MSLLALPLLIAVAASPAAKLPVAVQTVRASVEIIAAEEIRFESGKSFSRQTDRQKRTREGMALVEFY
jgi:hypothetical protein